MTPAADHDDVIAAVRFGWALAELRGRYRPEVKHAEPTPGDPVVKRVEHALPLVNERSPAEQRIEVARVVAGLSDPLGLNLPGDDGKSSFDQLMRTLDKDPDDHISSNELTEAFYNWDKHNQDALVLRPALAAGYQLGRGLAETDWEHDRSTRAETTRVPGRSSFEHRDARQSSGCSPGFRHTWIR